MIAQAAELCEIKKLSTTNKYRLLAEPGNNHY